MKKTIVIIILIIICLGLGGYIAYDKLYTVKEESKPNHEKIEKRYEIDLSKIECSGEEACEKEVKLIYNGENHVVKIAKKAEISNQTIDYYYDLYIDNKLVGENLLAGTDDSNSDPRYDFNGFLYVFDDKYLGFLKQSGMWLRGYSLDLFNDEELVEKDIVIKVSEQGLSTKDEKEVLNDLEHITFNGNALTFYRQDCSKNSSSENTYIEKVELTFDGIKSNIKALETIEGSGSGATSC